MTKEQILELLREVIEEITWKPQNGLTADTTLEELGFDSLDNIELIMKSEKKTGLSISDEDVEHVSSVGEMVDYLFVRLNKGVAVIAPKKEMVSKVEWQTGVPKERGAYIVSLANGEVGYDYFGFWDSVKWVWQFNMDSEVKAWCKLSNIEPYKGKEE